MCWNVRNLSASWYRRGVYGRDTPYEIRLSAVAEMIRTYRPKAAFLLEVGPDTDESRCLMLKTRLNGGEHSYSVLPSDDAGREKYILIIEDGSAGPAGAPALIPSVRPYRSAWYLPLQIADRIIHFLVFHAPSPSAAVDTRQAALAGVLANAALPHDAPIVFCGDLNFKRLEQDHLDEACTEQGFVHAGPSGTAGRMDTSLRRYTTYLQALGTNQDDSQPYDQCWTRNVSVELCAVLDNVTAPPVVEASFAASITDSLQTCTRELDERWSQARRQSARRTIPVTPDDAMAIAVVDLLNICAASKDDLERSPVDGARIWARLVSQLKGFAETMTAWIASDCQMTQGTLDDVRDYARKARFSVIAAIQYIQAKTGGDFGDAELRRILFEYSISDHFPIAFNIGEIGESGAAADGGSAGKKLKPAADEDAK